MSYLRTRSHGVLGRGLRDAVGVPCSLGRDFLAGVPVTMVIVLVIVIVKRRYWAGILDGNKRYFSRIMNFRR